MVLRKLYTLLRFLAHRERRYILGEKISRKLHGRSHQPDVSLKRWLDENAVDFTAILRRQNSELWAEAEEFAENLYMKAERLPDHVTRGMGGPGCCAHLYFLTRYLRPRTVIETGVALGYTSEAFLAALGRNGKGVLYSSDLPYFGLVDAERRIGALVTSEHRGKWKLYLDGDTRNLEQISRLVDRVDLIHYDSDKSYEGRQAVLDKLQPFFTETTVVVMDDVGDNSFFRDHVEAKEGLEWYLFEWENKFVGVMAYGSPLTRESTPGTQDY